MNDLKSLTIMSAVSGGYLVAAATGFRGEQAYPLFAGTLVQCLEFIQAQFSPAKQADPAPEESLVHRAARGT